MTDKLRGMTAEESFYREIFLQTNPGTSILPVTAAEMRAVRRSWRSWGNTVERFCG